MDDSTKSKDSGVKKPGKAALGLIFLTIFIDLVGFGLIIPALPTYAQAFQASDATIGLLISSYSLMQFIFIPFWGRLSDKIGRRPVLLISLAFSAIGYMLWGFADSLAMLFVARMIAGFGNSNLAVAQAYVADVTTAENRAKGMGLVGAAFGLGFVIGPALGCALSFFDLGLAAFGFAAATLSILDLVLTYFLLPEPGRRSEAGKDRYGRGMAFYLETIRDQRFRVSLAIFFLSTFAFAMMEGTIILLANKQFGFDNFENMCMFTYIGVLMVIVQGGLIHRLSKKFGEKKLITTGSILVAAGLLLAPSTNSALVLYAALALLAIGSGLSSPANQSMLSKLSPGETVGGVMGVGQSLSTLGRILGPALGTIIFQSIGMASPYFMAASVMLLVGLLSLVVPEGTGLPAGSKLARS